MRKLTFVLVVLWCMPAYAGDENPAAAIGNVIDTFHEAAATADSDLYFSLLAKEAVFLGTDASERWSVEELKAFAEPYFSQGRGWIYTKTQRHIHVAENRSTAWFDEMLWNESYGRCRGTGVLVLTDRGWRIAQYSLSIPIPNELARELTSRIKGIEAEKAR